MDESQRFNIAEIFQEAFDVYKKNFQLFITVSLVFNILSTVCENSTGKLSPNSNLYLLWIILVNLFISSAAAVAMIFIAGRLYQGQTTNLQEALSVIPKLYWRYIRVYVALLVMVMIGFQLLILPGLFAVTIFFFVPILVVLERTGFQESFRKSMDMVRNCFGIVFLFLVFMIAVSFLPWMLGHWLVGGRDQLLFIFNKVIAVVVMPFYIIAQVGLYQVIKRFKEEQRLEE